MARILVIDDEKDCLRILHQLLQAAGHEVLPLLRADRIGEQLQSAQAELVITDLMMPGVSGGTVYSVIRAEMGSHVPVVVSSATKMKLRSEDPLLAYCPKPLDFDLLLDTVERLLRQAAEQA